MDKISWKWIVGVGLAAMLIGAIMGSTNITGQRCASFLVDDAFDMYFDAGRRTSNTLDISYNSDDTGPETGTTIELYFCTGTNPADQTTDDFDNCQDFMFDTDGNGMGDQNVLDAANYAIERVGVRGLSGFMYLRARRTGTAPAGVGATPILTVCRRSG